MRHVVLDTEVFRRENLAFDSARFRRLAELADENEIEIHLTDVIYEEVRRAIAEQVRIGIQTLRQEPIRRALNVIAHGAVPKLKELLGEIDESDIVASLHGQNCFRLSQRRAEPLIILRPHEDIAVAEDKGIVASKVTCQLDNLAGAGP